MEHIQFKDVSITDGFFRDMQEKNRKISIYNVRDRFKDTGRFEAFKFNWKEGMPNKPHFFWDSDVAKWMEAVAYINLKEYDEELESEVEALIDLIEKNQDENGYFNVYFTICDRENRFTNRTDHELYSAGHLFEAAVAYYEATGRDRFLKSMCKYADYIHKVFVELQTTNFDTPGHPEIELALIRLYNCTKNEKYLELVRFFVDKRGASEKDIGKYYSFANSKYDQSHLPVREQKTAEGHSVRACYLYAAMADLAKLLNDCKLFEACKSIFLDIISKKMYITGGIGQTYVGEAFTIPYDLPNKTAYAETCAAISLVFFAQRMLEIETNSVYADIIERVIYNGAISGTSLDGKSYFYENALEVEPALIEKDTSIGEWDIKLHFPALKRVEVFWCSCCPPNMNRFIASIGDYIYGKADKAYYVHQYISSTMSDGEGSIIQKTSYPKNGIISITTSGISEIALRIPAWCEDFSINKKYILKNGYAYVSDTAGEIILEMKMTPRLIVSNAAVSENANRAALTLGPIVYCIEEADNGKNLRSIMVSKDLNAEITFSEYFNGNVISVDGFRPVKTDELYAPYPNKYEECRLKFIPYYGFANREIGEMVVWVNVKA